MTATSIPSFLSYGTASDALLAALESLAANRGRPTDAWVMQVFTEAKYAYFYAACDAAFAAGRVGMTSFEDSPWMEFSRLAVYAGCWPLGAFLDEGPCISE